ncbi:MAG: hypothetical protein MESAZ_00289 [Saezia sanguinis]
MLTGTQAFNNQALLCVSHHHASMNIMISKACEQTLT